MMDKDGYSRWRGWRDLGKLASGDYPILGALIWSGKLISLTLLLPTRSKTMLFELGVVDQCILYL